MNPEYNDIELIEQYLAGRLSAADKLAVERRMSNDPEFAKDVEVQKISGEVLEDYELLQIKKRMQKEMPQLPGSSGNDFMMYTTVGVLIVAGLIGLLIYKNSAKENTSELVDSKSTLPTEIIKQENNTNSILAKKTEIKNNTKLSNITEVVKDNKLTTPNVNTEKETLVEKDKTVITNNQNNIPTTNSLIKKDSSTIVKPCDGLVIETQTTITKTCEGKTNGSVKINQVKGGISPYKFRLGMSGNFSTKNKIDYLAEGEYELYVKDGNGCIYPVKDPVII
jgi:hypothetical protein